LILLPPFKCFYPLQGAVTLIISNQITDKTRSFTDLITIEDIVDWVGERIDLDKAKRFTTFEPMSLSQKELTLTAEKIIKQATCKLDGALANSESRGLQQIVYTVVTTEPTFAELILFRELYAEKINKANNNISNKKPPDITLQLARINAALHKKEIAIIYPDPYGKRNLQEIREWLRVVQKSTSPSYIKRKEWSGLENYLLASYVHFVSDKWMKTTFSKAPSPSPLCFDQSLVHGLSRSYDQLCAQWEKFKNTYKITQEDFPGIDIKAKPIRKSIKNNQPPLDLFQNYGQELIEVLPATNKRKMQQLEQKNLGQRKNIRYNIIEDAFPKINQFTQTNFGIQQIDSNTHEQEYNQREFSLLDDSLDFLDFVQLCKEL
jgi:hypothetical protein